MGRLYAHASREAADGGGGERTIDPAAFASLLQDECEARQQHSRKEQWVAVYGEAAAARRGGAHDAASEAEGASPAELSEMLGAIQSAASHATPQQDDDLELHHYAQVAKIQAIARRRSVQRAGVS